MADSVENWDNILRDWAKNKVQKSLAEALNRFEKPENIIPILKTFRHFKTEEAKTL